MPIIQALEWDCDTVAGGPHVHCQEVQGMSQFSGKECSISDASCSHSGELAQKLCLPGGGGILEDVRAVSIQRTPMGTHCWVQPEPRATGEI